MAGNLTITQDYEHKVQPVAGWDPMHALMKNASPATSESYERGTLVSLSASGEFEAGCGASDMPMWATTATDDFDANSDVGGTVGLNGSAYVATGGYELFTTEYVSGAQYDYNPNTMLTAATGGDAGKVVESAATYNDAVIVGCVSDGTATEVYDQSVLYFWPMFIPAVSTS